jgi:TolB-like protein
MTVCRLAIVFVLTGLFACASPGSAPRIPSGASPDAPGSLQFSLPQPLVISVLYFENRTRLPELGWLSKGLADMLITDLSQAPGIRVVHRERLEELVKEQLFQIGGRVDEQSAVRIGRMTGATVMLVGSASALGETLRLDAHLYDVERGTVLGAASVEGPTSEAIGLEKLLSARILGLLKAEPASGGAARGREAAPSKTIDAEDGENVPPTASAFETAKGKESPYGETQRYERALRNLNDEALWSRALGPAARAEDRLRVGTRIIDDLLKEGLTAEVHPISAPHATATVKGTTLELQIHFDNDAVQRLRHEVDRLQGRMREHEGRLIVEVDQVEVREAFARSLIIPRRPFVHLAIAEGQQVAIYSQKKWSERPWVWVDTAGRLILDVGRRLVHTLVLPDLFFNEVSGPTMVWVSMEPVPREQALLQVELLITSEDGREVLLSPVPRIARGASEDRDDDVRLSLSREFLDLWNPPVWERIPGPGYLPSARRSVIVVSDIRDRHLANIHLAGTSGDFAFDQACLNAIALADGTKLEPLLAVLARHLPDAVRLRVSCDLLKETPSLLGSAAR